MSKKNDIKDFIFESLPYSSAQLIIIAWGRIINDQTGSYKQEIVLKRYSENDDPSKTWNLRDRSNLFYSIVDLGSIKVLSPGTIIQDQKIKYHIEEYLTKREIVIDSPRELEKKPFRFLYDPTFPEWEREIISSSVDKIETRLFKDPTLGQVIIPCSVIADYYYFGKVHLIQAVLEGKIDLKFKSRNDVFNPSRLAERVSPNGKTVVVVELHRRMDFEDQRKIARLAYDEFFRWKCRDISTGIMNGKPEESFVNSDLPVKEPTTLSVYGVTIDGKGGRFFLVHSISMCNVKPPFDLIIAGKNFRPKSKKKDGDQNGDKPDSGDDKKDSNDPLILLPEEKKKKSKTSLEPDGKKIIGGGSPKWDSVPLDLSYPKDQEDNFPNEDAIKERDFDDPSKQEVLAEILTKFALAVGHSTNPGKKGSSNILQLKIFGESLKPKPAPPTTAFEIIEKLTNALVFSLVVKNINATSRIRCPFPEGEDKYSAFPIKFFEDEIDVVKKKLYLDFCYLRVKSKGYVDHRRVFIMEISVGEQIFYVMDVEPKYKTSGGKETPSKFVSSFGVIFYSGINILSEEYLGDILKSIVRINKASLGQWKFLNGKENGLQSENKYRFQFKLIKHHNGQRSYDMMMDFVMGFIHRE